MPLERQRPPHDAGADFVPARLCLELQGRAEHPVHVVLGVSATGDHGVAALLAAEWLASVFGQMFTGFIEDRAGESSLGTEAFYDALDSQIGNRAFVAAIGLADDSASRSAAHAESFEFADDGDPITLHVQGTAHALLNRASGRAVVMFDHLPGAIELVGKPAPAPCSDADSTSAEATAWYGFGTVKRLRSRGGLRSGISHGVVEGELKSLLAEYL